MVFCYFLAFWVFCLIVWSLHQFVSDFVATPFFFHLKRLVKIWTILAWFEFFWILDSPYPLQLHFGHSIVWRHSHVFGEAYFSILELCWPGLLTLIVHLKAGRYRSCKCPVSVYFSADPGSLMSILYWARKYTQLCPTSWEFGRCCYERISAYLILIWLKSSFSNYWQWVSSSVKHSSSRLSGYHLISTCNRRVSFTYFARVADLILLALWNELWRAICSALLKHLQLTLSSSVWNCLETSCFTWSSPAAAPSFYIWLDRFYDWFCSNWAMRISKRFSTRPVGIGTAIWTHSSSRR